jgi:predicted acyl esterase
LISRPLRISLITLAALAVTLFPLFSHRSTTQAQLAAHDYTAEFDKLEVMIPTRDGVKLHTEIYIPKGADAPLPLLFERTPYGISSTTAGGYSNMLGRYNEMISEG